MSTLFTKIIEREIPGHIVAENASCSAFLDIDPLAKGHTLVVPKKEVDRLFELDDATYQELTLFAKRVAEAIEAVVPCNRVGVAVLGLEVPHAHIHLVPIQHEGDLNFSNPRVKLSEEEMEELAGKISAQVKDS